MEIGREVKGSTMKNEDPAILLIDDHWGIHTCKRLAEYFPLFDDNGDPLASEDIDSLTGNDWPEAWDWLEPSGINCKDDSGLLWRVEWSDGALWAIHPEAEWSDDLDWYTLCKE